MIPLILDCHEEGGVELRLDLENGMSVNFFMDDETAKEMIDIIQNKINARL